MKKLIAIVFFLNLFGIIVFSQAHQTSKNILTLEQAVSGQYQQFYPEHITGFEWIKHTPRYAYLQDYRTLMVGEVGKNPEKVTDVREVNNVLGTELRHLVGLQWRNEMTFVLNQGNIVVVFHVGEKEGRVVELPREAKNITFDPTLTKVAYTIENNLFYSLTDGYEPHQVTNFEDKNIVSGQSVSRSEMGIKNGIFWSPSGEKLAFYKKDESKVHDYPLLDINPTPGELKSIKYPMAGQESERVELGIYNLPNESTEYIQPKNGEDYYLTNVAWTPDDQFILLAEVARSQKHIWLQKYKNNGDFVKTLFEETASTWVEPEKPAYFPSKNNNDFVWVSERDGFDNLYYYSIEGKLISQLTKNKFVLKEVVAHHHGEIFFTATGENPLNTLLYKVNIKGKQVLLTKEEGTHNVQVNCTGEYVFDQYSSSKIPNRAVLRNGKNGKVIEEMLNADNPLENYQIPKAEIKILKNKEGTELYSRMYKPTGFDASQKYPVLIYVYGGPHAQLITNSWLDGSSLWMHWMAEQGYIVFTLDNRGSANRGVDFEHVIHRNLGVAEFEDQMTGVNYLKSLPYVDADRIAVHGWSYGGFMTITMMLDSPDDIKVGVAGGPVTDWKYYEVMYGERYMDTPEENTEGYEKTSLLNKAENLEGNLLMIHGSVDPIVVPQHALSLIKVFVENGIQTDFFMYPMHEHNVRGKDRVHLMRKVLEYVLEKNK